MLTFKDLVDSTLDFASDDASKGGGIRSVTGAIQRAYRSIQDSHEWRYFRRIQIQQLNAFIFNTGNVTYTAATRTVTWNTTLPTWFGPGCALVTNNDTTYDVQEIVFGSTTSFILAVGSNPGVDSTFAAGSAALYQFAFDLPVDFRSIISVGLNSGAFLQMWDIATGDMATLRRRNVQSGTPRFFAIQGSVGSPGKYALNVWPNPGDSTTSLQVFFKRSARPLRLRDYSTGTITGTAGNRTLTGTGTAWTANMAGSVIRLTDGADIPTGYGDYQPYLEELVIDTVTSATSMVLTTAPSNAYNNRKYIISDPVDLPDGMVNLLIRLAEKELRLVKRMTTTPEEQAALQMEMSRAMETDSVFVGNSTAMMQSGRIPMWALSKGPLVFN